MVNKWDTNYTLKVNQKKNFRNFTLQHLTFKCKDFNINYLLHFWSKGREISKRCLDRWHNRSLIAWSPASHSTEDNTMMPMTAVVITKPNQLITKLNFTFHKFHSPKPRWSKPKTDCSSPLSFLAMTTIIGSLDQYYTRQTKSIDTKTKPSQINPKPVAINTKTNMD